MARIDWTRTLVDASGLRPTASDALMPIRPTAMAAPRAAKPTCKFPLIVIFPFSATPAFLLSQPPNVISSFVRGRCLLGLVLANQQREDGRQQHEDQSLDQANEQLQKIKGDWQQPAQVWYQIGHGFQ